MDTFITSISSWSLGARLLLTTVILVVWGIFLSIIAENIDEKKSLAFRIIQNVTNSIKGIFYVPGIAFCVFFVLAMNYSMVMDRCTNHDNSKYIDEEEQEEYELMRYESQARHAD